MAMATRVVGEEEGEVGKGDGDGNEETATRRRRDDDETTTRRRQ
jgi:ribosomal protein S5